MAALEGFVSESPDGNARIYLREDAREYVEVDAGTVREAVPVDHDEDTPFQLVRVEVDDEAERRPGRLEQDEFDSLFDPVAAEGPRPASKSPDCETAFNYCYSRLYH